MPVAPATALVRARRTAAYSRGLCAVFGAVVVVTVDGTHPNTLVAAVGFVVLVLSAVAQVLVLDPRLARFEETLASAGSVLVIGLGSEQVTVVELLWLCAVVGGIMGRGGRVHWLGTLIVAVGVALPIARTGEVTAEYAAFALATTALLLSTGRLTRELSGLLAQARHAADYDALTGALSRSALREAIDARAAQHEVAVLLLDLDGFGQINKAQGHAAGDQVLKEAAGRMQSLLSESELLGRLGGDEFAIVATPEEAATLGPRLLDALRRPHGLRAGIGASVGLSQSPEHGVDADALLRAADVAQRIAKRGGKGRVVAYHGTSLADLSPAGALGALKRLIAGDGVTIVTQPIVDVTSGRAHIEEALARFHTRGTSSPAHWFALAEEYGLQLELELACLRSALELFAARPADVLLSVNLSAPLVRDERVAQMLEAFPSLEGLVIEVTERSLADDDPRTLSALNAFSGRGARVAVDDMGAGYSGLRQVTVLHPDYIKLDRELVRDIHESPERIALLEALVGYAHRTGSAVIAEGVEQEAELELIRRLGMELVQGFLLARPGLPFSQSGWSPVAVSG